MRPDRPEQPARSRLERARLETRIPPPLVMLACGGLAWLGAQVPATRFDLPGAMATGIVLALAGLALNLLPKLAFGRAGTTVNPLHPGRSAALVTTGLHRFSRNPMYLGHSAILAGLALALGNALAFAAVPAYAGYITRFQIRPEERALHARFGEAYAAYLRRVPRWL